ncbi:MAG: hypothetical protein U9P14_12315 [Gemmatimonadota bacterium]|nr:hypothetical protein [Gemmatimonadota bacterium]
MAEQSLTDEQVDGWWDIARTGKWQGSQGGKPVEIEIDRRDLEEMAATYSPDCQEAPVTVEHRREGPAHGWVEKLRVKGSRLQARLKDLSSALRQWLRTGAYRSRSIEMYKPFTQTGKTYLGAVSFLGAAAPAVKGLAPEPTLLASVPGTDTGGGALCIDSRTMELRETPKEMGVITMDDRSFTERVISSLREFFSAPPADGRPETADPQAGTGQRTMALEQQLEQTWQALEEEGKLRKQAEEKAALLEASLKQQRSAVELARFAESLSSAEAEGLLSPAEAAGYLKLGSRLEEDGRKTIIEEIRQRQPSALFSELSAPEKHPNRDDLLELQRSRFRGFPDDPEHDAALKLMAGKKGLSFSEAIALVRQRATQAVKNPRA